MQVGLRNLPKYQIIFAILSFVLFLCKSILPGTTVNELADVVEIRCQTQQSQCMELVWVIPCQIN